MKKQIALTNKGLQYLYILTGQILARDIATVKKVNLVFNAIEPTVIAYETKGQDLLKKGKEIQQLVQFANEKHQHAISAKAYETPEAEKEAADKIEQGKKDLEAITVEMTSLDSDKVKVSFDRETFAFLTKAMEGVLGGLKTQDGSEGVCGRKDLLLIEEVFTAIENSVDA